MQQPKYIQKNDKIVQDKREAVNRAILNDIISKSHRFDNQSIFSYFTGKGKLHGLKFNDHDSFHQYTEAKKEKELGQFFTPDHLIQKIYSWINPTIKDIILDPMGGVNNFCNYAPNEQNFTSIEIDKDNHIVAKQLYPLANNINYSTQFWKTNNQYDFILTNPAFGLDFGTDRSETFILKKARTWLKTYGIFIAIVPQAYLQDEMRHKRSIEYINENYTWLGQIKLDNKVFKNYELNFPTKIIAFQNLQSGEINTFDKSFQTETILKNKISLAINLKEKNKLAANKKDIKQYVFSKGILNDNNGFEYRVKKYFYELNSHPELKKTIAKGCNSL